MDTKAIIFDLNGVLIDSNTFNAGLFRKIFAAYSPEAGERAARHYLHNGGIPRRKRMEMYLRDFARVEPDEREVQKVLDKFSELLHAGLKDIPLKGCVREFLQENYGKYRFFVASGAVVQDAEKVLKAKGIYDFFERVYGSPEPKHLHVADIMREYGYRNNELVFFGDSVHDKAAADKAGVRFVAVKSAENDWKGYEPKIDDFCEEKVLQRILGDIR